MITPGDDFKLFACRGGEPYAIEVAKELEKLILKRKKGLKDKYKDNALTRRELIEWDFIKQTEEEEGIRVSIDEKITFGDGEINVIIGRNKKPVVNEDVRRKDVYLIQHAYNTLSQVDPLELINNMTHFYAQELKNADKNLSSVESFKKSAELILKYTRKFGDGHMSVNDNIMETLIHARALRSAKANNITLVSHYMPYSRGDKIEGKESVTARTVADALVSSTINSVVFSELHAPQIVGFFPPGFVEHLSTAPLFIHHISNYLLKEYDIMTPDTGGAKRANKVAKELGKNLLMGHKTRDYTESHKIDELRIIGKVTDLAIVSIDDIITSGSTGEKQIEKIRSIRDDRNLKNTKNVYLLATFPQLVKGAVELFDKMYHDPTNPFKGIITTDLVPHNGDIKYKPWYTAIKTPRWTAEILYRLHTSTGLSAMHEFDSVKKLDLWNGFVE